MKKRRVTMKDVAEKAGVSTATVSYVLNYSNTERISHETRLKVFEAANELNYIPNIEAKSLSGKKSYMVGVIINKKENCRKSMVYQYYDLADEMRIILNDMGYDMFLVSAEEIEQGAALGLRRALDAVFIVDMEEEIFRKLASQFYVPAIFIDGYVSDPLFCKILVNGEELLDKAEEQLGKDFYVVMEDCFNNNLLKSVKKRIDDQNIFIHKKGNSLPEFLQTHRQQKGLVIGEILGMQAESYVDNRNLCVVVQSDMDLMLLPDTKILVVSNKEKARKAIEVMRKLLHVDGKQEDFESVHDIVYVDIH